MGLDVGRVRAAFVIIFLGLVLSFGIWGCECSTRAQKKKLVTRVSELAAKTKDPKARNAAVEALFAAGSEKVALELLKAVKEERPSVLLSIARYTALRGREEESVTFVGEAIVLASAEGAPEDSAKALDAVLVDASKIATATRSREILARLMRVGSTRQVGSKAASAMFFAACEIAVDSGEWDLLSQARSFEGSLTEDEDRDFALTALTWAEANRAVSERNPDWVREGVMFADSISDQPRKAMAFGLLAEAARNLRNERLLLNMVGKLDEAMVGTAGPGLIEGLCRIALVFHPGGRFAKDILEQALAIADRVSSFDLDMSAEKASEVSDIFGWLTARYYCWIARVALEEKEPDLAATALKEAVARIAEIDPELSLLQGVPIDSFVDAVEYLHDAGVQRRLLNAVKTLANRAPDPIGRSMALASISRAAQRIAITEQDRKLRSLAWQSVTLIPIASWQEEQLVELSYTCGRLQDPNFVSERLSDLITADDPALELKVLAGALKGLAEANRASRPRNSRFLLDTHLTASDRVP